MSRKSKFSYEIKLKVVKKYLNGEASVLSIAKLIGADESHFDIGYMHSKLKVQKL